LKCTQCGNETIHNFRCDNCIEQELKANKGIIIDVRAYECSGIWGCEIEIPDFHYENWYDCIWFGQDYLIKDKEFMENIEKAEKYLSLAIDRMIKLKTIK
jgi:hypothetical protein